MSILRAIFCFKDDQPLLVRYSDEKVDLDALRNKQVLLLISDLEIPQDDIDVVKQIYTRSRKKGEIKEESQFEIIWLPIVDSSSNDSQQKQKFQAKRKDMPWLAVDPSLIAPEVIKLTKDEWHFDKQPIIVVIDSRGQVACRNALPMMFVWKDMKYPFTMATQEALWKEKTWNLHLLLDDMEVLQLMSKDKCICLYGGEDMEWIKMFTTRAPSVAKAAGLSLEMFYVGKKKASDRVQKHINTIQSQGLSSTMTKERRMQFWNRIVNMGRSRMQLGMTIYEDTIMQEIVSLLHMDDTYGCVWAAFGYQHDLVIKNGHDILDSFIHFVEWKNKVEKPESFIPELKNSLIAHGGIDFPRHIKSYEEVAGQFQTAGQMDGVKVLKASISGERNAGSLLVDAEQREVNIDQLQKKELLLLVSNLDIERQIVDVVKNILHGQPPGAASSHAIVWLPIVESPTDKKTLAQFEDLRKIMPGYHVRDPAVIKRAVVKFIREVWGFRQNPILVMLDEHGKVACSNALHLTWTLTPSSFSLSNLREENPWKDINTLELKMLLHDLDLQVTNWIKEGKLICLYGGEDMEWIRKFTTTARNASNYASSPLEMVYVGRSKPNKQVEENLKIIENENLSHCLKDQRSIWLFWYRIESMCNSRYHQLGGKIENDKIFTELISILSLDGEVEEPGWALFCRGSDITSSETVKAKRNELLKCLSNSRDWKKNAPEGFLHGLKEKLSPHKCYQLVLPDIWPAVNCLRCNAPMESSSIVFRCCGK